jgi:hypothetical protein
MRYEDRYKRSACEKFEVGVSGMFESNIQVVYFDIMLLFTDFN